MNAPTAAETFELRDELWEAGRTVRHYRHHFGADTATAAKLDHLVLAILTATTELSNVANREGFVERRVRLVGNLPDEFVPESQMDAFETRAANLDVATTLMNGGPGGIDYRVRGPKDQVNILLLSDHVEVQT